LKICGAKSEWLAGLTVSGREAALCSLFLGNKPFSVQTQSEISAGLRQICNAPIAIFLKDASFSGNLTHITVVTIPETCQLP
jgi:hypothetical protein